MWGRCTGNGRWGDGAPTGLSASLVCATCTGPDCSSRSRAAPNCGPSTGYDYTCRQGEKLQSFIHKTCKIAHLCEGHLPGVMQGRGKSQRAVHVLKTGLAMDTRQQHAGATASTAVAKAPCRVYRSMPCCMGNYTNRRAQRGTLGWRAVAHAGSKLHGHRRPSRHTAGSGITLCVKFVNTDPPAPPGALTSWKKAARSLSDARAQKMSVRVTMPTHTPSSSTTGTRWNLCCGAGAAGRVHGKWRWVRQQGRTGGAASTACGGTCAQGREEGGLGGSGKEERGVGRDGHTASSARWRRCLPAECRAAADCSAPRSCRGLRPPPCQWP